MEAIGFAVGIIGVLPLCVDGIELIAGMLNAKESMYNCLVQIEMQKNLINRWALIWGVPRRSGAAVGPNKLKIFFERDPDTGRAVLRALSHFSVLLMNTKQLEKKYGLRLPNDITSLDDISADDILDSKDEADMKKRLEPRRKRMNRIQSACQNAKFKLKDEKDFKELIALLNYDTDVLLKMCSELEAQQIERSMLEQAAATEQADTLEALATVTKELAAQRRQAHQRDGGLQFLSEVASFKASLRSLAPKQAQRLEASHFTLGLDRYKFGDNNQYTLAIDRRCDEFRYIVGVWHRKHKSNRLTFSQEWRSYADPEGQADQSTLANIEALASFATDKRRPRSLAMLQCQGVLHEDKHCRRGFVYQIPGHLAHYDAKSTKEGSVSPPRKPTFLSYLVGVNRIEPSAVLDLGVRFNIAKRLAQSLYVLHTSGWVHKK